MRRIGPRNIPLEETSCVDAKGTVIIIPHWIGTHNDLPYRHLKDNLKWKYDVIGVTLYGRGEDNGRMSDARLKHDVEDYELVVGFANRSLPLVVYADSLGAAIAMRAHDSRPSAFVFSNPAWGWNYVSMMFQRYLTLAMKSDSSSDNSHVGPAMIREFTHWDTKEDLRDMPRPVYVCANTKDYIVPHDTHAKLFNRIGRPLSIMNFATTQHVVESVDDCVKFTYPILHSIEEAFKKA